jgi:hypothetical protein
MPKIKVVEQTTSSNFYKGQAIKFSIDLEINFLEVTFFLGPIKLYCRALTKFLRAFLEMLVIR